MGDSSSASDSENAALTNTNTLTINSCTIATQTPELPRHGITTQTSIDESCSRKSSFDTSSVDALNSQAPSVVVLRVDKGFTEDFEKEVKALAIPEVVVEYIKDSCALTENTDFKDENLGTVNLGFEGIDNLHRCASSTNLRIQDTIEGEEETGNLGAPDLRKCYSMPRHLAKKDNQDSYLPMRSPQLTPKLQRLQLVSSINKLAGSSTSLNVYPNGHNFVAPPSPNFGYRPLESETSAVYTIIKTCLNTNEVKEIHLLNALSPSVTTTPALNRKFEYSETTPPNVLKKQRWLQCCTDACSAIFFIPGLIITLFTPVIIIPMLLLPMSYFIRLSLLFLASGALGVFILTFSGLIGNLVWYYDENSKGLKLRLHCGRGPRLRFWGNGFYSWSDAKLATTKENSFVI